VNGDALSGFVGIVLQPDGATVTQAYALAAALLPGDAAQVLAPGALPHITLTQCALREAPRARVKALVGRLDALLAERTIPLRRVVPFPGGFLFWCVDDDAPARALLQSAHEQALALADGGLDADANDTVIAGTARATGNDPRLVENARRYGYAFVKEQYRPHITLGFAPESVASFQPSDHVHTMRVERVAVARLGRLGRVDEIVTL
jgi:2'-5' RNA ligase